MATKSLPQARTELERAQTSSQKLNSKSLQARAAYLLATNFRLSGNKGLAADRYRAVLQMLDDIRKETGDKVLQRADFAAMSTEAKRWMSTP